jgi:hypothetical protein
VVVGVALHALWSREFRWEGLASTGDLAHHATGAVLMGIGGVMAMGCTIGQGLSALSTLSIAMPAGHRGHCGWCGGLPEVLSFEVPARVLIASSMDLVRSRGCRIDGLIQLR